MQSQDAFKQGIDFYAKGFGGFVGGDQARLTNGKYLSEIQSEIDALTKAINNYKGNGNPQLKGFVAEAWHAHTYNIEAAAKRSVNRVIQDRSNKLGSTDISTSWGNDYSLKYYKSGDASAMAQGHSLEWAYNRYIHNLADGQPQPTREEYLSMNGFDPKTDMSLCLYEGQARLIPSDQIQDAINALNKRISKELNNQNNPDRAIVAKRLMQVRDKLTSHLESPDGVQSLNLTESDAKELARLGKDGNFDPERYDITLAKKADYLHLCHNVMKAGLNAAWISALIKMVPGMVDSLKILLKEGYIDVEDLKEIGKQGVSGAKSGFLNGFICAAISTASEIGLLGASMQSLSASVNFAPVLATMVILVGQSVADGIKVTNGEISDKEFAYNMERNVFVAIGSVLGGMALQSVIQVPVISYAIGSMLGSLLGGLVFTFKENVMMSLCVRYGYTVFGIVDQDYTLPAAIRKKLGFPVFGFDDYRFNEYQYKEYKFNQYHWKEYSWKTIDCILLKRGVIGCRKVGYIESLSQNQ